MSSRKADWGSRTSRKTPGTTVQLGDQLPIDVSPEQLWGRMSDARLVARCVPGVDPESLRETEPNTYQARMVQSVMGMNAAWDLQARLHPIEAERRIEVQFDGVEPKLGMKLHGTATVTAGPDGSGSGALVYYAASLRVDGSLAAMGGPVIRSVVADTIARFVAVVGGIEPARKPSVLRRFATHLRALWSRIRHRNNASS